jgi:hypothetical protein
MSAAAEGEGGLAGQVKLFAFRIQQLHFALGSFHAVGPVRFCGNGDGHQFLLFSLEQILS